MGRLGSLLRVTCDAYNYSSQLLPAYSLDSPSRLFYIVPGGGECRTHSRQRHPHVLLWLEKHGSVQLRPHSFGEKKRDMDASHQPDGRPAEPRLLLSQGPGRPGCPV